MKNSQKTLEWVLDLLIASELKFADSAYCSAEATKARALLTLFDASDRNIEDFGIEEQNIINEAYYFFPELKLIFPEIKLIENCASNK